MVIYAMPMPHSHVGAVRSMVEMHWEEVLHREEIFSIFSFVEEENEFGNKLRRTIDCFGGTYGALCHSNHTTDNVGKRMETRGEMLIAKPTPR